MRTAPWVDSELTSATRWCAMAQHMGVPGCYSHMAVPGCHSHAYSLPSVVRDLC